MPSPDFAGSSFANASSGDTDPVAEFNESSFGSPEQTFMGDLVRFWYGSLFLFASSYALLKEGHAYIYEGGKKKVFTS